LLIDEFDKSDINLPNDLLNLFEEGSFEIPELARISKQVEAVTVRTYDGQEVQVKGGRVQCAKFPLIVLTSNGERDFPPAFLRRCLRLTMPDPNQAALTEMVKAHLGDAVLEQAEPLIISFLEKRNRGDLSPDQLLNAIYLVTREFSPVAADQTKLMDTLLKYLSSTEDG
jgi:MoxR-like ATPase